MGSFIYSDDNKRYHTLSYHNKHTYGEKVHKAAIDAGLTCPNIDGSRGVGGCIYCSGGSGYFTAKIPFRLPSNLMPSASVSVKNTPRLG